MKKIIAIAMVVVLALTAVVGTTFAYFTDEDSEVNVMTVGNVDIELLEHERVDENEDGNYDKLDEFTQEKDLSPIVGSAQGNNDGFGMPDPTKVKNYVDKIVRVENTGKNDAYVRVIVAFPAALDADSASDMPVHWNQSNTFNPNGTGEYTSTAGGSVTSALLAQNVTIDGIEYNLYSFTYGTPLKAGEITAYPAITGLYMDSGVEYDADSGKYYDQNGNVINYDFSNGVILPVYAQAIQAQGFESAEAAFAASGMADNPWAKTAIVSNTEELNEAIAADAEEIVMLDGDYTLPATLENVELIANGDNVNVAVTPASVVNTSTITLGDNVTLKGLNRG